MSTMLNFKGIGHYYVRMTWVSLVSALVGAGIGVGSTLLVDLMRWKRERGDREQVAKREFYVAYLAAMARWRNGLREVAYNTVLPAAERWEQARQALPDSGAYEKRLEMFITGPPDVVRHAEGTYKALRNMKDPIAGGLLQNTTEYRELVSLFEMRLQGLRTVMRADLGIAVPEAGVGFPGVMP